MLLVFLCIPMFGLLNHHCLDFSAQSFFSPYTTTSPIAGPSELKKMRCSSWCQTLQPPLRARRRGMAWKKTKPIGDFFGEMSAVIASGKLRYVMENPIVLMRGSMVDFWLLIVFVWPLKYLSCFLAGEKIEAFTITIHIAISADRATMKDG